MQLDWAAQLHAAVESLLMRVRNKHEHKACSKQLYHPLLLHPHNAAPITMSASAAGCADHAHAASSLQAPSHRSATQPALIPDTQTQPL